MFVCIRTATFSVSVHYFFLFLFWLRKWQITRLHCHTLTISNHMYIYILFGTHKMHKTLFRYKTFLFLYLIFILFVDLNFCTISFHTSGQFEINTNLPPRFANENECDGLWTKICDEIKLFLALLAYLDSEHFSRCVLSIIRHLFKRFSCFVCVQCLCARDVKNKKWMRSMRRMVFERMEMDCLIKWDTLRINEWMNGLSIFFSFVDYDSTWEMTRGAYSKISNIIKPIYLQDFF